MCVCVEVRGSHYLGGEPCGTDTMCSRGGGTSLFFSPWDLQCLEQSCACLIAQQVFGEPVNK